MWNRKLGRKADHRKALLPGPRRLRQDLSGRADAVHDQGY